MHSLFWYSTFSWSSREIENFNFRCLLLSQNDSVRSTLWILSFQSDSVHSILWKSLLMNSDRPWPLARPGAPQEAAGIRLLAMWGVSEAIRRGLQGYPTPIKNNAFFVMPQTAAGHRKPPGGSRPRSAEKSCTVTGLN